MWLFSSVEHLNKKNVALVIPTSCHALYITTLQSMMDAKLSQQRFRHCHENWLIKTIQTISHKLYVSFKSASLYWGLG